MDLAVLVRHVVRRESSLQGESRQTIKVPESNYFPDQELWSRCGMSILDKRANSFLLEAMPWLPEWLSFKPGISPESSAYKEVRRRTYDATPGDPILAEVDRESYRSPGQREAIRGLINAPPGATLVVNLPTGSGKSLCVQLPALTESHDYGVSLVIVPTTALAIDQERAMSRFVEHPTAYYGDTSLAGQRRRQEIRDRIREGTQRIVFTSPESALGALTPSLYSAAERGFIRLFAVDEVHMIDQWGDGFRSAFQELPGLRLGLLKASPAKKFKTVLMTGTLTESTLDILESLFGGPGPFEVVSAMQLRPEPSYWFAKCSTEDEKASRVLEALCHLPRPTILYTTLVEEANRWGRIIRGLGANRLAVMTGKSSSRERIDVIDRWRKKDIDLVIATSAFGLGVDQADVRSVVHACVPETIDRFYQEVGRGGRDGSASLSLVIYSDEDVTDARKLNKRVSIGADRGKQRWDRMFNSKEPLTDDRWSVKIDIAPGVANSRDINMQNEQNQKWNIRTLTLMACSGVIMFDSEPPPRNLNSGLVSPGTTQNVSDDIDPEGLVPDKARRIIRILDENHLEENVWAGVIEANRKKRGKLGRESFRTMYDALMGKECIAALLSRAYAIPGRTSAPPRKEVIVSRACGGCRYCREQNVLPYAQPLPTPGPVWQNFEFPVSEALKEIVGNEQLVVIFYSPTQRKDELLERLRDLARWLAKQGVRNIVDPADLLRAGISRSRPFEIAPFLFREFEPVKMPRRATFIIHPVGVPLPLRYLRMSPQSPIRIILVPDDSFDPNAGHRRLRDVFNGKDFRFEEICTILAL